MKINIIKNSKLELGGFTNTDEINLDSLCEDAECTNIVAAHVLDYLPGEAVDDALVNWVSKLRHGGTLVITGVDLEEVARGVLNKNLDLVNANILLFGNQATPKEFKQSCITLDKLVDILHNKGLHILKQRINQYEYIVEAQRP